MNPRIESTLQATGYLSREQLWRHFGVEIDQVPLEPWMARTRDGLWNNGVHSKGTHLRHWELISEIYLALFAMLTSWSVAKSNGPGPRPDALLTVAGGPGLMALEADTGQEDRRAWTSKLARFRLAPEPWHLLVITTGKSLRQRRLGEWLAATSPLAWVVLDVAGLTEPQSWNWSTPNHGRSLGPPEPRLREYRLDGQVLPRETAEQDIEAGNLTIAGRERLSRLERVTLQKAQPHGWLGSLIAKFFLESAGIPTIHREITDKLSVRNGGTHDGD